MRRVGAAARAATVAGAAGAGALAAGAAAFWALYIVASARLGPRARGVDGLGVAMVVAALFLTRSGRGRVLYDDPAVLGDRMA